MDTTPSPFIPPAPVPRTKPPNMLKMFQIVYNNPIELWGAHSYREPYVYISSGIGGPLLVANDPQLIRLILVERTKSFKFAKTRQIVLRPILQDGLLTAENPVWKRSRKAMAPVFTPKNIHGFAEGMLRVSQEYVSKYEDTNARHDIAKDMTELTFNVLAETLFTNEIEGDVKQFEHMIERLFETVGRVDPFDIINVPEWVPRIKHITGRGVLRYFRKIVRETIDARVVKIKRGKNVPDDFLTLLLRAEGDDGLSRQEVEDNVITFIGAGHETTARALGWTLYLLAKAPHEREKVEAEAREIVARCANPLDWVDRMPHTRAAFDEAMRLYPPAPVISREALEDIKWKNTTITKGSQCLVMPWTLHRHRMLWENPDAFMPSRFLPGNREKIDRFQYLPFGVGPRVCIGSSFAIQEAIIILATMMSRFRFDMAPGAPEPWPLQRLTTQPGGGLHMVATKIPA
ncbi:MAG: cytochrome P450 [Pseudomonadota bacterium]